MNRLIEPIAKIYTGFPEKFGIPRQSRLADTEGLIVFESSYRNSDALRGLEDYTHIWLIWGFQDSLNSTNWSPTVRPPRLGGNIRRGVFATRSPFRPNGLGLSLVEIKEFVLTEDQGTTIRVKGVDMLDGTLIFDIKPYIPYLEAVPQAKGGFTEETKDYRIQVIYDKEDMNGFPEEMVESLIQILSQDPRPGFHHDSERIYGMKYLGFEIKFRVMEDRLYIISVQKEI